MCQKCGFSPSCKSYSFAGSYPSLLSLLKTIIFGSVLFSPSSVSADNSFPRILSIRGGLIPPPPEDGSGIDFYENFELDYGRVDRERQAGSMRGFLKTGALSSLPESDPFKKWLNKHLETGAKPFKGRVKPFVAEDFGSKKDLGKGENPVWVD
jgi:hypothetical protein